MSRAAHRSPPLARVNPSYAIARAIFSAWVHAYFRRIEVRDPDRVPRRGPLLVVANHPAALTDALVLGTQLSRRVHFLAMSPLFKPWLRGVLMRAVGALPIHRKQDDPSPMQQNDLTFQTCHEFFDAGGAVLMFPEGNSDTDRRVTVIKTGAARLALAQVQRGGDPLTLLPVGIYFENRTRFQSEVIVSVGEPIALAPYAALAAGAPRAAVQELTQHIQRAIESLIQVIPEPEFTQLVQELENIYLAELQSRGDPRHQLELKRRIAACVDYFRRTDPERVVAVGRQLKHYLRTLHALHLHDRSLRELESGQAWRRSHVRRVCFAGLCLPVVLVGSALHWLPFEFCSWVSQKLAPHPTRVSAMHMISGFVVFPSWWLLLTGVEWRLTGWDPPRLALATGVIAATGFVAAWFMRWFEQQPGFVRLPMFALSAHRRLVRVRLERRELIRIFDRARADFLAGEAAEAAATPPPSLAPPGS